MQHGPVLRNVVVPVDGSPCAAHAFEYAPGLATAKRARLEICSYVGAAARSSKKLLAIVTVIVNGFGRLAICPSCVCNITEPSPSDQIWIW